MEHRHWKTMKTWWRHASIMTSYIKWKHFPRYWPFVRRIHRSPVNSPHKGQWRGALMFPLICAWINGWVNNPEAGDLRRHHAHYDTTVMKKELGSSANGIFKCNWWKSFKIWCKYTSYFSIQLRISQQYFRWCYHACLAIRRHDDVVKWKHFPRYWTFVRGIHRSPVNSPHEGQWRGALMFSLICVWINDWVNNCETGDLRRYRAHYDIIVMS